ncbi:MAG: BTAD domain-containing putative transcriptional regulator [Gemmatimonadaceae bacterium]|nr:BTAD domain-containing putative transcriptional regulator [Gemmatimonadaceae bacterium]
MRIKLFGPPSVWRDDTQLAGALAQRRRLALLSVLAVAAAPGRPGVTRERILALLWSNDDEERARAALSQALYAIRRDLGADDAIVGQSDLRLNPQRVSCDYWDFLQAVAEGADQAAAELRIGPLLDGLDVPDARDFEFWVEEQRTDADRVWATAADRVATAATNAGDTATAVRWRRALANADPLSGRSAVALALALNAAGEREAALRHLRVHAALVEQELESAPSAEVTALAERLAAPAPASASASSSTPAAPAPPPAANPTTAPVEPAPPSLAAPSHGTAPTTLAPTSTSAAAPTRRSTAAALIGVALVVLALVWWLPRRGETPSTGDAADVAAAPSANTVFAVGSVVGDSLGNAVAGMLATNLSRAQGVEVISTARMLELTSDGATPLAAARAAGATELIDGTLLKSDSQWRLEVRRTDIASGRVSAAWRATGTDVFGVVDKVSADLLRGVAPALPSGGIADVSTRSLEAWRLYEEALRANTDGRRDAARALLRGALRADSTFAMAALILSGLSDPVDMPLLQQALRMSDRAPDPQRLWIRAIWYQATDDPRFSAVVDTMVSRYPTDLDVQMMIAGPALFNRADFGTATATLARVWRRDSALAAQPGRARCYTCEATVHLQTVLDLADSLPAAERWARKLIAIRPTDGVAWLHLAQILERDVTRHADMLAAVDSAVRLGAADARSISLLGATRRGDTVAFARVAAQMGWTPETPSPSWHWARALLYRNVGRFDEALREARAYAASAARGPATEDRHTARTLEAAVLLERGDGRAAAAIWDSIARIPRPETTPSKRARQLVFFGTLAASARYEAGDTKDLGTLADSLAVIGARSGFARDRALHHHVRGLAYLAAGRREEAIAELQRSIVYPSAGLTRSNLYLGAALEQAGRPAEAKRWYDAAARSSRDAAPLYVNPIEARRRAEAIRLRR